MYFRYYFGFLIGYMYLQKLYKYNLYRSLSKSLIFTDCHDFWDFLHWITKFSTYSVGLE